MNNAKPVINVNEPKIVHGLNSRSFSNAVVSQDLSPMDCTLHVWLKCERIQNEFSETELLLKSLYASARAAGRGLSRFDEVLLCSDFRIREPVSFPTMSSKNIAVLQN